MKLEDKLLEFRPIAMDMLKFLKHYLDTSSNTKNKELVSNIIPDLVNTIHMIDKTIEDID